MMCQTCRDTKLNGVLSLDGMQAPGTSGYQATQAGMQPLCCKSVEVRFQKVLYWKVFCRGSCTKVQGIQADSGLAW